MTERYDSEDADETPSREARGQGEGKSRRASRRAFGAAAIVALIALGATLWVMGPGAPGAARSTVAVPAAPRPVPLRTGDLDSIKNSGTLVVAIPYQDFPFLPGHIEPLYDPVDRARGLARALGVSLRVVREGDAQAAVGAVVEKRADLAAVPAPIPQEGDPFFEEFEATAPLFEVSDVLVTRSEGPKTLDAIDAITITLPYGADVPPRLAALAEREDLGVTLSIGDPRRSVDALIDQVADGLIEATVARRDFARSVLSDRPALRATIEVSEERAYAWPVRRGAPQLAERASDYLRRASLLSDEREPSRRSWDEIKRAGVLRIATVNGPSFFVYDGRLVGFDYALARGFAIGHDLRVAVEVAPDAAGADRMVAEGRADLAAVAAPADRARPPELIATAPVTQASWSVVGPRRGAASAGARIARALPSDLSWEALAMSARARGYALEPATGSEGPRELLASLLVGETGLAVVQSGGPLAPPLDDDAHEIVETLIDQAPLVWRVRATGGLDQAISDFLQKERASGALAKLAAAYASTSTFAEIRERDAVAKTGELSPFDHLFREYGELRNLDWRLLASQAYQESRFDPKAKSWAGAVGLMQLMPRTARWLGVDGPLTDPEESVEGGTKYLRWLYDHLEDDLAPPDRLRFAIASYNAGQGHVADGRALAEELGLDPDRWYGNVDVAIANLSKQRFAKKARYGYCRCEEAVAYVRLIEERYAGYVEALNEHERTDQPVDPIASVP